MQPSGWRFFLPPHFQKQEYFLALSNLPKPDDNYIYRGHENCRISFQTWIDQCLKKFSSKSDSNVNQPQAILEDETLSALSTPARTPRHSNVMESSLCIVCNTREENEEAHYNNGGWRKQSFQQLIVWRWQQVAPHIYLPQMYFITNQVYMYSTAADV